MALLNQDARAKYGVASDTLLSVKTTTGYLHGLFVTNGDAAVRYLQVFNVASTDVTLGATVPYIVIPLAASASANVNFLGGVFMTGGISCACTTTANGAVGATAAATCNIIYQ